MVIFKNTYSNLTFDTLTNKRFSMSITNYTVTTFIHSKEGKQLSTMRALQHIKERLLNYNIDNSKVFQCLIPPISVALCPTSNCVRKCSFCSNTNRNRINQERQCKYTEDVFYGILTDLREMGVKGVSIAGGGEPLSFNHKFLKIFFTQSSIPYKIGIHTNGYFLDNFITKDIVEIGNLSYVNVSVFSHNAELYKKIANSDKQQFYRIENNIKKCISFSGINKPAFGVKILICRENYKVIDEIVNYYKDLGVDNVLLRCVGNFEPDQDVELSTSQIVETNNILKTKLRLNEEQINGIIGKPKRFPPRPSRCWIAALQYTAGIDPDGEIYICSPWSQKDYSLGNVNNTKFSYIWGGERHIEVIYKLNENLILGRCNPLTCRHYYSNLAIDAYINGEISLKNQELNYVRFI